MEIDKAKTLTTYTTLTILKLIIYNTNKLTGFCMMEALVLTLSAPCISESWIEIKTYLNFYFHTSLWCLKTFY